MCARCDQPLTGEIDGPAAATSPSPWVDIPVSADQPAEVALLCHFLSDRGVAYETSRRFVTLSADAAVDLVGDLEIWAFHHDLPDDDRHSDSLAATQRRVGSAVLQAIETATGVTPLPVSSSPTVGEFEGEAVR
ncbi:MAG: hypothetical protein ACRBI6_15270 [Acidimicrobiales bacterium]